MKAKIFEFFIAFWLKHKKVIVYFGLFLALLSLSYALGRRSARQERDNQTGNLIAARDSVHTSSVTINGLKNSIWEKNAIILGQKQAIEVGIVERDLLKKLHIKDLITNTELSGIIKRQDSLLSLPPNTVFITVKDSSGITQDYIKVPFQLLNINDEYLSLDAGMDMNRLAWHKLSVPFDGIVSVGFKKSGFLKADPVGIFTSTNPYLTVNKMDVLIVKEQEKWFQRWWVHCLAGAGAIETVRFLMK